MARVDVDLVIPRRKLSDGSLNRGRYALANQALGDMNQFVPMRDNILRQTGHVNSDATEVIWNTPYARRMFYVQMYNYTTPGTGPRWDLKAKARYMSDWERVFVKGADW